MSYLRQVALTNIWVTVKLGILMAGLYAIYPSVLINTLLPLGTALAKYQGLPHFDVAVIFVLAFTISRSTLLYKAATLIAKPIQISNSKMMFIILSVISSLLASHLPLVLIPLIPILARNDKQECSQFKLLILPLFHDADKFVIDIWRV